MSSRKLQCEVMYENLHDRENNNKEFTLVTLKFNRKLTSLELSGVKAVMSGDIK